MDDRKLKELIRKLKELIKELESQDDEENAHFGIQRYGGPDNSFVQDDKEGLIRFAKELLKASTRAQETDGKVIYPFNDDDMSEFFSHYAENVDTSNDLLNDKSDSDNPGSPIVGCLVLIVFLGIITLTIMGIATAIDWFF